MRVFMIEEKGRIGEGAAHGMGQACTMPVHGSCGGRQLGKAGGAGGGGGGGGGVGAEGVEGAERGGL